VTKKPTYKELEQRLRELERKPRHEKEINERVLVEEVLRESEEKYRSLADSIADVFFAFDSDLKYTYWNKASEKLIGIPAKDAIGKHILEVFPDNEETRRSVEVYKEVLKTQQPRTFVNEYHLGGERHFFDISAYPSLNGLSVFVKDITAHRQVELMLEESEEKFRNLAEQSPNMIFIHDMGRVVYANQRCEEALGYTREEFYSDDFNFLTIIAPEYRESIEANFARHMRGEEVVPFEYILVAKDGRKIEAILTTKLIGYGGGSAILGTVTDITKYKCAEEEKARLKSQLLHAEKMEALGTLAGGIAHNFNNLLMGIIGNTSLMLLETDSDHPNYRRLKSIEKSVQSGSRLTNQLLSYARGGSYEIKPLNLNHLIEEVSETFEATKKEIRILHKLTHDLYGVMGDQGQIAQVLLNLYVNATDAMPGGGDLFLSTTNITDQVMGDKPYKVKPGGYVLLTVRDTGVGMDRKTTERIFEPFFTTKGFAKGTGLGLASVYGIIKAHGGYIDVESTKGMGTTFSIYLPSSGKIVTEKKRAPKKIKKGSETLLLVDDEAIILDIGKEMLEALGYEVIQAPGGREAVEIYRESKDKISLVILDMIMPEMSGETTYSQLEEINPHVKVLLSSGYSIDGPASEILERGCDGFIQKPFDMKQLAQKIREILDKQ